LRRKSLIVLLLAVSLGFNVGFFVLASVSETSTPIWPFAELGPALVQDSYRGRAPTLESPFGMIGDVPGGYSLYAGNALQTKPSHNLTEWISGLENIEFLTTLPAAEVLVSAVLISLCPLLIVIALGRKSFGSKKTR
jgi:hypothetical protein